MSTKVGAPIISRVDSAQQDPPTADDEDGNLSEKKVEERFKDGTPIISKFDSAQQDPPSADDKEGNLSEKNVKERYEALSEDTKQLFKELGTELDKRYIGSVSDISEWGAHLSKILKTPDYVDLFTKWRFFGRSKPENYPEAIKNIDYSEFRDVLKAANWKYKNEAYERVFHLMWNTSSDDPARFVLKSVNQNVLAVAVNPRCLTPRDPLRDSLEAYNIIGSNLINILGMRYHTGHMDHATKDMIIAPFGQILFWDYSEFDRLVLEKRKYALVPEDIVPEDIVPEDIVPEDIVLEDILSEDILRFSWRESEYALVLEIRDDGKAGDFYFVYNGALIDSPAPAHEDLKGGPPAAEAEDGTVNFKPVLFGQGPFTVGKLKSSMGLEFIGYHDYDRLFRQRMIRLAFHNFDPEENIQLEHLSKSKPEVMMTGIRESWEGKESGVGKKIVEIVSLYDEE